MLGGAKGVSELLCIGYQTDLVNLMWVSSWKAALLCIMSQIAFALFCWNTTLLLVKHDNTERFKQQLSPLSVLLICVFGTVSGHSPLPPLPRLPAFLKARRTSPVSSPESALRNAKFSTCKMASRHCRRLSPTGIRRILAGCRANYSRPAASLKREYDAVVIGAGERQRNEAHLTHRGGKEAPHGQIWSWPSAQVELPWFGVSGYLGVKSLPWHAKIKHWRFKLESIGHAVL